MSLPDDRSQACQSSPSDATAREGATSREPDKPSGSARRTWLISLAAGLLAGLFSAGIGEVSPALFPPDLDLSPEVRAQGSSLPVEITRRRMVANDRAAELTHGALGCLLGLCLGAAGGLVRRSARAAIAAAVAGLILGGTAAAATTKLVLPVFHSTRAGLSEEDRNSDLALALRTHGLIWTAAGAAAGLALGLGLGGGGAAVARATFGGILGAALGTVIYEFAGALYFPVAETFQPVAKYPAPRMMAQFTVALCVAAGACWAVHHLRLRRAPPRAIA
jgi:hypothetical protein